MVNNVKADLMITPNATDEATVTVAALFEQHHEAIFAYLVRLLHDREWAHDLTQDVFLQLFRHKQQLPQIENQRAWIYRIASNLAFSALKRQQRFQWLPWRSTDDWHQHEMSLEKQIDQETAVSQILAQLPDNYRAPLLLYSRYDFNVKEIATILNISQGAVKNRLWRARDMFRKAYAEVDNV